MTALVQVKRHHPSGTIVLQRAERAHALSRELIESLRQALGDLHQERKVRAVIITGAGDAFCAGIDLREMQETAQQPDAQGQWYHDVVAYQELIDTMLRFPKPIIAAVNGPAVGSGLGLALACDLVVGSRSAQWGVPEPRRGLVAGVVAPLLAFRIGVGAASPLLLTGRLVDSESAARLGICHEIVEDHLVWARAQQLAEECALNAPESLQLTKRLINEMIGEHLGTMLTAGAAATAPARTTEAAAEGVAAFLEKRSPKWL
ncbi:MAG: enoyl-CoA hydratase/isomerase family protein [Planctomycetota bacterium]